MSRPARNLPAKSHDLVWKPHNLNLLPPRMGPCVKGSSPRRPPLHNLIRSLPLSMSQKRLLEIARSQLSSSSRVPPPTSNLSLVNLFERILKIEARLDKIEETLDEVVEFISCDPSKSESSPQEEDSEESSMVVSSVNPKFSIPLPVGNLTAQTNSQLLSLSKDP